MKIRLSGTVNDSIVDGPGIRYTIFTQGCNHNCKGCQNQHTHNINGGFLKDTDEIIKQFSKNPLLDGITLSGGEPFLQPLECLELAKSAHKRGLNVFTYTGFIFEDLLKNKKYMPLLLETDYLVDGKFILELKSLELMYKGSSNQRIIDVKRSLLQKKVVICKINEYGEIENPRINNSELQYQVS